MEHSTTGGPLLARSFDFEVDEIFDVDKAVFFVEEDGKSPFVSVAWPGLVGVVSGMNAEGLALVVHGARAGPIAQEGVPVLHAMRRILAEARDTVEAAKLLDKIPPLVSHIVLLQDAEGRAIALERSVHQPHFERRLKVVDAVTNHFEGPLKDDTKNQRVRWETSTLPRRARADLLISQQKGVVSPGQLVEWLRDKKDRAGRRLPLGDRRAIDAFIATHGVVMDTRARKIWVSRGPRLLGAFVEFDLIKELSAPPPPDVERAEISEDPQSRELRKHLSSKKRP